MRKQNNKDKKTEKQGPVTKKELRKLQKVDPVLPYQKGYTVRRGFHQF